MTEIKCPKCLFFFLFVCLEIVKWKRYFDFDFLSLKSCHLVSTDFQIHNHILVFSLPPYLSQTVTIICSRVLTHTDFKQYFPGNISWSLKYYIIFSFISSSRTYRNVVVLHPIPPKVHPYVKAMREGTTCEVGKKSYCWQQPWKGQLKHLCWRCNGSGKFVVDLD